MGRLIHISVIANSAATIMVMQMAPQHIDFIFFQLYSEEKLLSYMAVLFLIF